MIERCDECYRRFDRPAGYSCDDKRHPKPTLAQRIAKSIEDDLNNRGGQGMDQFDHKIQDDIRDTWAELINKKISDMMVDVCQILLGETE